MDGGGAGFIAEAKKERELRTLKEKEGETEGEIRMDAVVLKLRQQL